MNSLRYPMVFLSPAEHGGSNVKGGRPQAAPETDADEQISDALGEVIEADEDATGAGVPGSRTNPVHGKPEPEEPDVHHGPTGTGAAAG